MGLLRPVDGDERETLRAIIRRKKGPRKARLKKLTSRILRRYRMYYKHSSDLAMLSRSTFEGTERKDCEHCYDQETVPLSLLKQAVFAVLPPGRNFFCPLCGLIPWETLDHFAPKSTFPEFSVLAKNLIPCCWTCNHLKGDVWVVGEAVRVLNVYFDRWPRARFLKADVDFDPDTGALVSFSLLHKPLGRVSRERLQVHFDKLELGRRFAAAGASAVDRYHRSLSQHGYRTLRQMKRYLRGEALALAAKHGPNHWESVLLDALANCHQFLNSI